MVFYDWLLSLSWIFSRFIYDASDISASFLLQLNNVPFYGYATSCFSIHQLMNIWVIYIS